MFPIYEKNVSNGIGLDLNGFVNRFDTICREHLEAKRANAFAFIFYDFHDQELRRVLSDQGVFTYLDRLSGNDLSVFYIQANKRAIIDSFNETFSSALGLNMPPTLPCIVFFRLEDLKVTDIKVTQLERPNLLMAFQELYNIIESHVENASGDGKKTNSGRWIKSTAGFVTLEAIRAALRELIHNLMQ